MPNTHDKILRQEAKRFPPRLREDMISEGMLALCVAGFPEAPALQHVIARRAMINFYRCWTGVTRAYPDAPQLDSEADPGAPAGQEALLIAKEEIILDEQDKRAATAFRKRWPGGTAYLSAGILRHIALGNLP